MALTEHRPHQAAGTVQDCCSCVKAEPFPMGYESGGARGAKSPPVADEAYFTRGWVKYAACAGIIGPGLVQRAARVAVCGSRGRPARVLRVEGSAGATRGRAAAGRGRVIRASREAGRCARFGRGRRVCGGLFLGRGGCGAAGGFRRRAHRFRRCIIGCGGRRRGIERLRRVSRDVGARGAGGRLRYRVGDAARRWGRRIGGPAAGLRGARRSHDALPRLT